LDLITVSDVEICDNRLSSGIFRAWKPFTDMETMIKGQFGTSTHAHHGALNFAHHKLAECRFFFLMKIIMAQGLKKFPHPVWNLPVHYSGHKRSSLKFILSWVAEVHTKKKKASLARVPDRRLSAKLVPTFAD
jgi:hypothetical protein